MALSTLSEDAFSNYLRYCEADIKESEKADLKKLCLALIEECEEVGIFEDFYWGYKIPQISREFDLLRLNEDIVVNIEVKRQKPMEDVKAQLVKNRFYLAALGKEVVSIAYLARAGKFFKLVDGGRLEEISAGNVIDFLQGQDNCFDESLDSLFLPTEYLISPLNMPDAFVEGAYFLTSQQDDFENRILKRYAAGNSIITVTGKPGTGKTLLTYHISKGLIEQGKNVLIIHVGKLNSGHVRLRDKYGWNVVGIKEGIRLVQSSCDYDLIVVDEAQRMTVPQMRLVLNACASNQYGCLISYDSEQFLKAEESRGEAISLVESQAGESFEMSEKIRTNKEIAQFIKAMFNLNKSMTLRAENISIIHFSTLEQAKKYIELCSDYVYINYTPSQYHSHEIDCLKLCENCVDSAHGVIGQEFDNVLVIVDSIFFYNDDRVLLDRQRVKNPYIQNKMLYQAVTRTRRKLKIVVINNQEVFSQLVQIGRC